MSRPSSSPTQAGPNESGVDAIVRRFIERHSDPDTSDFGKGKSGEEFPLEELIADDPADAEES
ncbi:hypothetical protein HAHE_04700 [Haloferula helveola]|uniref:Uncharacterized protein n=1 Tax=Haloferula helveola TaxID=490095 RepID=A0ABN6H0X8_9BACT|nr:hypothetical protein HAHE_04700 [Haloferula helveola]